MPTPETIQFFAEGALKLSRIGAIATLELNQPRRRNALSRAMWQSLPLVTEAISADELCRVLIVRGAGGAFSAGADISEFAQVYADANSMRIYNEAIETGLSALRELARPTIALIEGVCVGGGCGLALACDLRFASTEARFGITPAKLGLAYSFADTARLVEKVGPARAKDMLFSGRILDAPEALAIGVVDRVAAPDQIEAIVLGYADQLAGLSQASIRTAKAVINSLADGNRDGTKFDAMISACFSGPDFQEGYSAFLEKRTPRFR